MMAVSLTSVTQNRTENVWRCGVSSGAMKGLTCYPHERDDHARRDRFAVREQLQQPADPDRRDHHAARARSEKHPPTDLEAGCAAAAAILPNFGRRALVVGVHSTVLSPRTLNGSVDR